MGLGGTFTLIEARGKADISTNYNTNNMLAQRMNYIQLYQNTLRRWSDWDNVDSQVDLI